MGWKCSRHGTWKTDIVFWAKMLMGKRPLGRHRRRWEINNGKRSKVMEDVRKVKVKVKLSLCFF
jgi:hypothetical protein